MRKIIGYTLIGLVGLLILCGIIACIIADAWLFLIGIAVSASFLFILALGVWLIQDKD